MSLRLLGSTGCRKQPFGATGGRWLANGTTSRLNLALASWLAHVVASNIFGEYKPSRHWQTLPICRLLQSLGKLD